MFFLFCVYYVFMRVCLFVPCVYLQGKDWPLGSRLWCITVSIFFLGGGYFKGLGSNQNLCPIQFLIYAIKYVKLI